MTYVVDLANPPEDFKGKSMEEMIKILKSKGIPYYNSAKENGKK